MPAKKFTQTQPAAEFIWMAKLVVLILICVLVAFIPGQNVYTVDSAHLQAESGKVVPLPKPYPYPVNRTGVVPGDDFTATGIVIRDVDSGAVMYVRNGDSLLAPASTTKILTALVALDTYNLDDIVTVRTVVTEGQLMGLLTGERISVENLLYGALIHSGNDAAYSLAEHYPGGVDGFVAQMNKKAKSIGLSRSSFTNPIGYDDPNHKMTPMDLSRLASAAVHNQTIAKMVAIPAITISDSTHTYYHPLKNVNELLGKIPGVSGIKTGWTEEAGENLVTLVERDGHRIVLVVLRSKNRFDETSRLIDWAYSNFQWQDFSPK
jgi:serine-type D-Ala-D-Ala carboxypeptidase (penicillin-binding protein 5/6)